LACGLFVVSVSGGNGPRETDEETDMAQYLVNVQRPKGYDGSTESAQMRAEISALNDEMVAAGVRVFVGGLRDPHLAKSLRRVADGSLTVTDGPFIESREFVGGFWVMDVPSLEAALEWGRKAATACRCSIEVRPFH
jgi:hypothetical protein